MIITEKEIITNTLEKLKRSYDARGFDYEIKEIVDQSKARSKIIFIRVKMNNEWVLIMRDEYFPVTGKGEVVNEEEERAWKRILEQLISMSVFKLFNNYFSNDS